MVRKNSVISGNNGDWIGSAGTTLEDSEWEILEESWTGVGWHSNDLDILPI